MKLRAAVHVHSDWSDDGRWSLEALARGFARRGYGAILLAEHDRGWDEARWDSYQQACRTSSTNACLLVPGVEYGDVDNVVHVTVWGDTPFLGAGRPTLEILRAARAAGAVSVLAHPERCDAIERVTDEWATLLTGVEVWNRKYDGWTPSSGALRIAEAYPHLRMLAGNDFHTRRQFFPIALALDTASRSVEAIYETLAEGRYRPRAFGRELDFFTQGTPLILAGRLEHLRLRIAGPVRRARRRRRRR